VGKLPFLAKRLENGITFPPFLNMGLTAAQTKRILMSENGCKHISKMAEDPPRRSVKGKSNYGT
jgi:hypothetical protein